MKICKECGNPGKFNVLKTWYYLKTGERIIRQYERSYCNKCQYRKANPNNIMPEVKPKPEPKARVIKPYKDLLGPSTQQMRNNNLIKNKYCSSDSNDNASVAFGWAFKGLIG